MRIHSYHSTSGELRVDGNLMYENDKEKEERAKSQGRGSQGKLRTTLMESSCSKSSSLQLTSMRISRQVDKRERVEPQVQISEGPEQSSILIDTSPHRAEKDEKSKVRVMVVECASSFPSIVCFRSPPFVLLSYRGENSGNSA